MSDPDRPLVFLVAGEPSGDEIGGRLIAALASATGSRLRFAGIGGEAMAAEGLKSLFPIAEISVMGLLEVLPRALVVRRRMRQTARAILALRPDVLVTIDSPGFANGVWRRLPRRGPPRVHYVAPTVWAWRPGRAGRLARKIDRLLTLLPFEAPYFEAEGLETTYVGHPVTESRPDPRARPDFRAGHGLDGRPVLGLLPGSRAGEIVRLLPALGAAAHRIAARRPGLAIVIPTLAGHARMIAAATASWPSPPIVCADRGRRSAAMAACDVAIAASGTATLELASLGVPMVVAYRVNPVTAALLRRMVKVDYVTIVNLLLERPSIPELLAENCRPDLLAAEADRLFDDAGARRAQLEDARTALEILSVGGRRPSERAAEAVLETARRANGETDE